MSLFFLDSWIFIFKDKNKNMKYVIIGRGIATAARIRRNDETAEIMLLEKNEYIAYGNCGLPYYIGGIIQDKDELLLEPYDWFSNRYNIDIRTKSEVIKVDPQKKVITVKNDKGDIYTESYDKLLIATEATPIVPSIEGVDFPAIFTLQNVKDSDAIKNYIQTKQVKNAVIVGAGFVGIEMTESFHNLGIHVSIIEKSKQAHHALDYSMGSILHAHLLEKGVDLFLDNEVLAFSREQNRLKIQLEGGKELTTDMILLTVGVEPDTKLAEQAGIELGEIGGIRVDSYMQTSVKDIYAIGDAVEYPHPLTGKPWLSFMANSASRQAIVAADNMVFGNTTTYEGSIGTSITKVFDMVGAATGLNEKKMTESGIPFQSIYVQEFSHAGCYPAATPLYIKLIFDIEKGRLYGGQIVGFEGVDKRIDQIALIIKRKGAIDDLVKSEQAYAPPFSSVKDPIAMAGYVAKNVVTGKMPVVQWHEIDTLDRNKVQILDVRTKDEFELGAIIGAMNIPLDDLRSRMDEVLKDKPLYVYCKTGHRGYLAQQILLKNGFKKVYNLTGGERIYQSATTPAIKQGDKNNSKQDVEKVINNSVPTSWEVVKKIDASGLQCPGPILKLKSAIDQIKEGEALEIISTDPAFHRDVEAWTSTTGNPLLSNIIENGKYIATVQKAGKKPDNEMAISSSGKGKTIIVFSDNLDRAIATFVLANGAAATGEKVTLFFTFWGLNVIKKVKKPKVKKDFFGKMFTIMLPSSSLKLKLSKFNMFGIGAKMMRHIMKKKGIESVEELRQQALGQGVEFIACEMSMNAMGIQPEELLDEVTVGGVATYIGWADKSNINLFI